MKSNVVRLIRILNLTLSWRRPLSYRNQSIFRSKSMDWFLYDIGLRRVRVKILLAPVAVHISTLQFFCDFKFIYAYWTFFRCRSQVSLQEYLLQLVYYLDHLLFFEAFGYRIKVIFVIFSLTL